MANHDQSICPGQRSVDVRYAKTVYVLHAFSEEVEDRAGNAAGYRIKRRLRKGGTDCKGEEIMSNAEEHLVKVQFASPFSYAAQSRRRNVVKPHRDRNNAPALHVS